MASYERPKDGEVLDFQGMDLLHPVDKMPPGKVPYALNVRRYIKGRITGRNTQGGLLSRNTTSPIHSLRVLNDTTDAGPPGGYITIVGGGPGLSYNRASGNVVGQQLASGLSGNPLALIPFRPNASVQPWMYVGDSLKMLKVRSDGLTYKDGIAEPQTAPNVTSATSISGANNIPLKATSYPWTNANGANSNFNYGQSSGGTPPVIVAVIPGAKLNMTVFGSAVVNGSAKAPSATKSVGTGFPDSFLPGGATTSPVVIGAFTDADGNVLPAGGTFPTVIKIGGGNLVTVPPNAVFLQVGIDSAGNTFGSNSGAYNFNFALTVSALATNLALVGDLTCYYWGDSPHSGPVAAYIWKNPNDTGGNTQYNRAQGSVAANGAGSGSITGNSFLFDTTPGDPTSPMGWTQLNADGTVSAVVSLFQPPIEPPNNASDGYADFNFCLVGSIFVPAPGTYAFRVIVKDGLMWGIGGGASWPGKGTIRGIFGQTETVVSGLPLVDTITGGTGAAVTVNYSITFPSAGIYPIEHDYDYWSHSGRTFQMTAAPTPGAGVANIPPLPAAVSRQLVQYRGRYRSTATGAKSNPSPASVPQALPVQANQVSLPWSPDPQVDVCDFFRVDSTNPQFTYVATGPNTNPPTQITDLLPDTSLGNELLEFDNYEPFPSIDLPRKGGINISSGVITWVSGDKFNIRWLFGTIIIIGSPTGVAYTLTARPFPAGWQPHYRPDVGEIILDPNGHYQKAFIVTGNTGNTAPVAWNTSGGQTIDGGVQWVDHGTYDPFLTGLVTSMFIMNVPDNVDTAYQIAEPILAQQCLPFLFGPTDNINFQFGVGDPNRPGTLYWCKGGDMDSAPQTNQEDITDPGEAMVNGKIVGGLGVVFSDRKAWLIFPNFFNAQATVNGTVGSTWSLKGCEITRGLYMPWCLAVEGSGKIFFRVKDGIHISLNGGTSQSITDNDLYPLFPHEDSNTPPEPIVRGGVTIYPPDDTQPNAQQFGVGGGFLYYDYTDINGTQLTLVYDIEGGFWVFDFYQLPVTIHYVQEGNALNGVLVGDIQGAVRQLGFGAGVEIDRTAQIQMPAFTAGDARAIKHWGDIYIEAGQR